VKRVRKSTATTRSSDITTDPRGLVLDPQSAGVADENAFAAALAPLEALREEERPAPSRQAMADHSADKWPEPAPHPTETAVEEIWVRVPSSPHLRQMFHTS
jgi:hypothetical protein